MNIYESIQNSLNEVSDELWNTIKDKVKEHFEWEYSKEGKHYGFGLRSGYLTDTWINVMLSNLNVYPDKALKDKINKYYSSLLNGKEEQ